MSGPNAITKIERIRARDGDRCWLCDGKLDFEAKPNSSKGPTIEHLTAKANGGTNRLENLVLAHPGCNKQLGVRPLEDKHRMRTKYQAARERTRAAREVCASTPIEEGGRKPAKTSAQTQPMSQKHALQRQLRKWQTWTAVAVGSAFLAVGFAAGMFVSR